MTESSQPEVTVLVTAHDAAPSIGECLRSLSAQQTTRTFEVLLVDDRSTDGTGGVARAAGAPGLAVLRIDSYSDPSLSARQHALDRGFREARGDWVLVTDADATVPPDWIEALLSGLPRDVSVVCGPVVHTGEPRALPALLTVDAAAYFLLCGALHALGHSPGAFLANAAIRRDAYSSLGGFAAVGFSLTEDRALVAALHRSGARLAFRNRAAVRVRSVTSLAAFVSRGKRVSQGGGTPALTFSITALLGSFATALLLAVGLGGGWWSVLGVRYAAGTALLAVALARTSRADHLPLALLYEPFALLSVPAIALARWARPVSWGGITYGEGSALPDDARPKRTVRLLPPSDPDRDLVSLDDFHHGRSFHRALVRPAGARGVVFQIEWFGGLAAHCQLRFRMERGDAVVVHPDGAREDVGDIVFSAEAATPNDRSFDIVRGQIGLYPVAYRLASLSEKARSMITDQGHSVTQIAVRLDERQSEAALRRALALAHGARDGRRFSSFSRNCGTEAFRVLDHAAGLRGPITFFRHFPHLGHRYLALRGLVDVATPLPSLEDECGLTVAAACPRSPASARRATARR